MSDPSRGSGSGVFAWRRAVVAGEHELAATTRLVALVMSLHMDAAGHGCRVSVETLARETALNRRTVQRALRELVKRELVERVERAGRATVFNAVGVPSPTAAGPVPSGPAGGGRVTQGGGRVSRGGGPVPPGGGRVPPEGVLEGVLEKEPEAAARASARDRAAAAACAAFTRLFGVDAALPAAHVERLEQVVDQVGLRTVEQLMRERSLRGAQPRSIAYFLPALEELAAARQADQQLPVERARAWVLQIGWQMDDETLLDHLADHDLDQHALRELVDLAAGVRAGHDRIPTS